MRTLSSTSLNMSRDGIISFFRENGGRGIVNDSAVGMKLVWTETSLEDRESLRELLEASPVIAN